jgi:GLPGLI family protein
MKRIFTCLLFSLFLTTGMTQTASYRVVYRHCLQMTDSRMLTDTVGLEAVLTGNTLSSNYRFGIMTPALKARIAEENKKNGMIDPGNTADDKQPGINTIKLSNSIPFDSIGNMVFWDRQTDSILVREKMIKVYVLTSEKRPEIKWEILPETRQILQHNCSKATTEFRGRKYTAWFAPDLPIPEGPWKFKGLPGLILGLEDEDYQVKIYATSVEIPSHEPVAPYQALGTNLTLSAYMNFLNEEQKEQMSAMEALFLGQQAKGNAAIAGNPKLKKTTVHKIEKQL